MHEKRHYRTRFRDGNVIPGLLFPFRDASISGAASIGEKISCTLTIETNQDRFDEDNGKNLRQFEIALGEL